MTYNFASTLIQSQPPSTVDEAVERLAKILDSEQKKSIKSMQEVDLLDLHFTLGLAIRNAFKLHQLDSALLKSCGSISPDDASCLIINKLWHVLNHE